MICSLRHVVIRIIILLLIPLGVELASHPGYKEVAVKDGGRIYGFVRLAGTPPTKEKLTIPKDTEHCGLEKRSPRLTLGNNNGVQNAIVFIEEITRGKALDRETPILLDQIACEYIPHVVVLPFGAPFQIANSDPILHNVHTYNLSLGRRTVFNIAQPRMGQRTTIRQSMIKEPGLLEATCDAGHAWMSAFVMVAEHPYYVVTSEDGSYTLDHVPPGTYRVKMWHAGVVITGREMERGNVRKYNFEPPYEFVKEVTVSPNQEVRVDFEFGLR